MYGLNKSQKRFTLKKIEKQKLFLFNNFISFGTTTLSIADLVKNSFINSHRYIAEINNRVYSLYQYSQQRNLKNIFITLTLPSEYHQKRTINLKNGQVKLVRNDKYNGITPKESVHKLTEMWKKIRDDRSYKDLNKDDRVYFRVVEPHKDGTPHLHISLFVPKDNIQKIKNCVYRFFPKPQAKVETDVKSPVAYLMKYILKTFDDLRKDDDNYTDLTLWYIYHGITKFYTSRTLISLDVYRVLGGRYSLIQLTKMYRDKELSVFVDPQTNKILKIDIDQLQVYLSQNIQPQTHRKLYKFYRQEKKAIVTNKIPVTIGNNQYWLTDKNDLKQKIIIPSRLKNFQLLKYYNSLDIENCNLTHFGITQNECIKRGLISGIIHNLNDFNTDISSNWLREEDLNLRPSGYE
jgi:flagellar biosynthesis/type III secretory pathway chaperone